MTSGKQMQQAVENIIVTTPSIIFTTQLKETLNNG